MKYAVVDSGPIIRGVRLERLGAEALVTIPEVLAEIRDKHARASLAQMPSELETREPSDEAIRTVSGFAKLTGDLPVLSSVDLRVLALTWMLQKETGGVAHLRTVPLAKVRPDVDHKAPSTEKSRKKLSEAWPRAAPNLEKCTFSLGFCMFR